MIKSLVFLTCVFLIAALEAPLKTTVIAEGGSIPLNETSIIKNHMIKVNTTHNVTSVVNSTRDNSSQFEVPEKNDGKQSVGRKGVTISNTTQKNVTAVTKPALNVTKSVINVTTTAKPRKPTITEADEDVEVAKNKTKNNPSDTFEAIEEKEKKVDYVVPIVVVILSVPLVAILFSVLYKRWSEWWQHRHYRRMDYLIEGMYNN